MLAGLIASASTFPMEVVRRRAMLGTVVSNPIAAIPQIVRAEGFAGLYKGYGVNVIKVSIAHQMTLCPRAAQPRAQLARVPRACHVRLVLTRFALSLTRAISRVQVAPSSAITFLVYEIVRNTLDRLAGDPAGDSGAVIDEAKTKVAERK